MANESFSGSSISSQASGQSVQASPAQSSPTQFSPTIGELERRLEQRIQSSYREWTGHRPQQTLCHFFSDCLSVVIRQSIPPLEELLQQHQFFEQLSALRLSLDEILRNELRVLIQEVLQVSVQGIMLDSDPDTGCTGLMVILESLPPTRNPKSIPKGGSRWPREKTIVPQPG